MFFRNFTISILFSICLLPLNYDRVKAQAVLPYTPSLKGELLEEYGFQLAQDAVQLIRFQEYALAASRARLAVELSPNRYETWFILGTLETQQGNLQKGVDALLEAKQLSPSESEILFALGNSYFQLGEYDSAVKELTAGLKINADVPQANFDLGNSYLKLGENEKAISAYEKAFGLEEKFWPAINNIGLIQYEEGKIKEAIASWQKALDIDAQQAEPTLAMAVALYQQGKEKEGVALAEKALKIDRNYGKIEFLVENLWGEKLIQDTKKLLTNPVIIPLLPSENNK